MRVRIGVGLALGLTAAGCGGGNARPAGAPTPRPVATAAPDASAVTLGQRGFLRGLPTDSSRAGWGEARPDRLDVGGDPALVITSIHWRGWGSANAVGVGRGPAFNLRGGSAYSHLVRVELRAEELGHCGNSGVPAYRNLRLRMPARPGAPMGQWFVLGGGEQGLCRSG